MKNNFNKIRIIFNPLAGRKTPLAFLGNKLLRIRKATHEKFKNMTECAQALSTALQKLGYDVEMCGTQGPCDAQRLSKEAVASGCELVVAMGGDGTINEVIQPLVNTKTALAVMPKGTANVFAQHLNLPLSIPAIAHTIAFGEKTLIDAGKLNEKYFCSMAGIGLDAAIIQSTDKFLKKILGGLAYFIVLLWELLFYPFDPILFTLDNSTEKNKAYLLIISNIQYYAGNLVLFPKANIHDGCLDVLAFKKKGFWTMLHFFYLLRTNKLRTYKHIHYFQCQKCDITGGHPFPMHCDAEYYGESPAVIEVVQNSLWIIQPKPGA